MRNLFSERFLEWIEWAIIVQLIVVALFVFAVVVAKLYLYMHNKRQAKRREHLLKNLQLVATGSEKISVPLLKRCAKDLEVTISVIDELDESHDSQLWKDSKIQIADEALCPKARRFAYARSWFKRYLATQCFHLNLKEQDEQILIKLIEDPVMLVSLDASEVAIMNPSQTSIDQMIDCFSGNRHIRQDSFAQILSRYQPHIDQLFINRLQREEDPYIKAFCYRMLTYLPVDQDVYEPAQLDANDKNLELSIASLKYLTHVKADNIRVC